MARNELDAILAEDRMDSFTFTSKEVREILATAKRCGVIKLTLGPMSVEFKDAPVPDKQIPSAAPAEKQIPVTEAQRLQQTKEQEAALKNAAVSTREAELAQMAILDPERYEALLLQGDLLNDQPGPGPAEVVDSGAQPAL